MPQRSITVQGLRQELSSAGGTANTIAKFTGPSTLGNSSVTDDGTTIAVTGILTVSGASTLTGLVTASAGIQAFGDAAAPAFTFTADPDTGLFSRNPNQLGISIGGTERLGMTSSALFPSAGGFSLGLSSDPFGGIFTTTLSATDVATFGSRILGKEGANVTAANSITLGNGNTFNIVGTTAIQMTTTTGWQAGAVVWLKFNDAGATIAHNTTAVGLTATILTTSAGTYTASANSIVGLFLTTTASALVWNLFAGPR